MNDLKYDYIELDLPNIQARWDKDRTKTDITIDKHVAPFVKELAIKYPNWRFVSHNYWYKEDRADAFRFYVYEGKEILGEIGTDTGRRDETGNRPKVFTVYNERISSARQRGYRVETKDMKKAMKAVAKSFGSKTLQEKMKDAGESTAGAISRIANDKQWQFDRAYKLLANKLTVYIMENWATFAPIGLAEGMPQDTMDSMQDLYAQYLVTDRILESRRNQDGAVVIIEGSQYAVKAKDASGGQTITVYGTDTLPPHIKMSVGLLKLIEDGKFLAGVGVRVSDSVFYVSKEAEA